MCALSIENAARGLFLYLTKWTPQSFRWNLIWHSTQRVQAEQGEMQVDGMTHMYTISLFVGSEEGVGYWGLDDFNLAALCIWCAGQSVVCIQRYLMLHHNDRLRYTYNSSCSYAIFCVCSAAHRITLTFMMRAVLSQEAEYAGQCYTLGNLKAYCISQLKRLAVTCPACLCWPYARLPMHVTQHCSKLILLIRHQSKRL